MGERGHAKTRGLAVYESSIYWVTVMASIFRADKVTGDNIEAVSDRVFENPFGLFIYNDPETETSAECITPTAFLDPTTDVTTTIATTTDTPTYSTNKRGSCVSTNNAQVTRGYFRKLFNSSGQEICLLDQRINSIDSLEFRSTSTCAIKCLHSSICEGFVVNDHADNKFCSLLDQNTLETNVIIKGCITYRKVLIV
ncbi:uncharacterized protein LOC117122013 isoform X2 [Anneissia japonica]|nr:uncharacterized protein LOC117122013 isoform X2 [Anneissia japonica]